MRAISALVCGLKRGAQRIVGIRGKHLERCPNWRGWVTTEVNDGTIHVYPGNDAIIHEAWDACPCGPASELHTGSEDGDRWLIIHHSLDGRERQETAK